MVRTCANPACSEPFTYFRSGKIYLVDRRTPAGPEPAREHLLADEYFWLCGKCAGKMTITLSTDGSVTVAKILEPKIYEHPSPLPPHKLNPFTPPPPHPHTS